MRVINFDKGSKRRMRLIRWKHLEIVSLVLLTVMITITIALVLDWMVFHDSDEPQTPYVRDQR